MSFEWIVSDQVIIRTWEADHASDTEDTVSDWLVVVACCAYLGVYEVEDLACKGAEEVHLVGLGGGAS